jgi:hypothetical protein
MKKQQKALTVEVVKKTYSSPELTQLASADETAGGGGGGPDFASEAS